MADKTEPRVLVIGAGSIGTRHLRLINEMGYPVAACDSEEVAFEAIRGEMADLETFTDLGVALASRPALVVVATPHALHAPQTVAALESGAHVLCEKPMADTLAAADSMIAAAERTGRVLQIGFMMRLHPCLVRMKKLIEEGGIGRPLCAAADLGSYRTLVCSRSRHQADVFAALLLDYTHQLDFVPWLLGKAARRVYAAGRTIGEFELKSSPNVIAMTLEHEDNLISEIHLDYCREPQVHTLCVTGDAGYISCDLMTAEIKIGKRADESLTTETVPYERDDMYREQFRNFVASTQGAAAPTVNGPAGRRSLEIVTAALASLKSGAAVEIGR